MRLSILQISEMCHVLSLLDLFLHKPVIHGFATLFVLRALLASNLQEFLFYLVLRLAYQFALEALLGVFGFEPVFV